MSVDDLKLRLKSNICGLYFFFGKDEYTKDFFVSQLRKRVLESVCGDMNFIRRDGKSLTPSALSADIQSYPVMSEIKMIEIDAPELYKYDEKTLATFEEILSDIPDYAVVVFFCRSYEYDGKAPSKKASAASLADILKKYALCADFDYPDKFKLSAWIQRHFASHGLAVTNGAVEQLTEMCGVDMYILRGEIEKLCAAVNGTVTEKEVINYCCSNMEYQTFDLSNAVALRQTEKAHSILMNLSAGKTEPLMIMGALIKNFSDMLFIKNGLECGVSFQKMASDMKSSDWVIKKRAETLSGRSKRFLERAVEECRKCDLKQKSFSADAYLLIDMMLQKIGAMENE